MQEFFLDFYTVQNNIKIRCEAQKLRLLMEDAKFLHNRRELTCQKFVEKKSLLH